MSTASPPLQIALQLALWTGQRQGDLLALSWSAIDGSAMRLKQSKTGMRVEIPIAPSLDRTLEVPRSKVKAEFPDHWREKSILRTLRGSSWTNGGFRASWRKACIAAGIKNLSFHDLRGTAVTRLAIAGCSVPEIATITGHSLRDVGSILDNHYLNRSDVMATSAIQKLEKYFGR